VFSFKYVHYQGIWSALITVGIFSVNTILTLFILQNDGIVHANWDTPTVCITHACHICGMMWPLFAVLLFVLGFLEQWDFTLGRATSIDKMSWLLQTQPVVSVTW